MEGFRFRYWKHCLRQTLRQGWICFMIVVIVWVYEAQGCLAFFNPVKLLYNLIIGGVLGIAAMLLIPTIVMLIQSPLYSVLDKQGFSLEYLLAYEKARINGKQFKPQYAVEYAEIFMRMGQPADAIKYLNTITLPANAPLYTKISYFYIYVMSALKIHNLDIAEDTWKRSMQIINQAQTDKSQKSNSYLMYLALIAIDLYAGQTDRSRLERAYEQTVAFLKDESYKKSAFDGSDFKIFLVYELNALGRTDDANRKYSETLRYLAEEPALFNALRRESFQQLERAKNGKLPFIN